MSQPEVPLPSTGLVAGKYQLTTMIGRGGMGSVWEARHVSLGTRFAIKFIEAEYADSQEARSRFDKEARAAATIQSKHAIQIYDHGVTEDGKPYIVMELLQGEPLDKRIERYGGHLPLQDTARIIQQVSKGLARAHERGIVHRDLKPENIFIVRGMDDDEEIAKVLDFGIAKIQSNASNPGITSSTKTGAVLGTPFYMSPEQARGLRNVDHRTDVWSLGVIAYKCVTGKLPFDGESVGDLLVKICTSPVPIPSQSVPGLPTAFDAWFMRALEREPDRRFPTVTELSEHLVAAAGLSARGSLISSHHPGQGSANQSTVASGMGSNPSYTPNQPGHTPGPQPGMATAPNQYGGNPYPSQTPNPNHGQAQPAAGGMTAAPFTSSQPVPGVSSQSRWKYIVGAAFAGLAVAGLGTGVAMMMKKPVDSTTANSVGITQPPPADSKLDPTGKPAETPPASSDKPADPTAANGGAAGTPTPVVGDTNASAPPHSVPTKGVTGKSGAGGKTGGAGGKVAAAPAPEKPPPLPPADKPPVAAPPTPPTPPVTTPAKKPANKNDPGY